MTAVDAFLDEVRDVPGFDAVAIALQLLLTQLDRPGDPTAASMHAGIVWIIEHPQHSTREKLEAISALFNIRGSVVFSLPEFLGWAAPPLNPTKH